MGAESIILLTLAGILLAASGLLVTYLFAPRSKNAQKGEPYECGIPAIGEAKVQFHVGYYMFALMFLIFDVEVMFLLAWAVSAKKIGMLALIEVVIFLFILFLGLLYAWKKGATKWD
jgi:NADH:ubiquinone oxidoreductase subunit 3 (subunit A)